MTAIARRWRAVQQLEHVDPPVSSDHQAVLMLGGPYPETRNTWVDFVHDLDPLASRWLAWAFEAYRITPRTHGQVTTCGHPEAKLYSWDPVRVTCLSCRFLQDLEIVAPLPSLEVMGDLVPDLSWLRVVGR